MTPSVSNVLSVYHLATAANIRDGLTWYLRAHDFARVVGGGRAHHVARNAGIIAALSPMNEWKNNKRKAAQLISQRGRVVIGADGKNGIGLSANVVKAVRIYRGEDPMQVLGGDKVTAFYRTILDPTGDIEPVIDRHAFDIAVGRRTNDKTRGILDRKGVYTQFANVYREAAVLAGIGSAQMQAITWVAWKEMHGIE